MSKATEIAEAVLQLLDQSNERSLLPDIVARLTEQSIDRTVTVTSSVPLTEQEKAALEAIYPAEPIRYQVNPNILGGLIIDRAGKRLDRSLISRLNKLTEVAQ